MLQVTLEFHVLSGCEEKKVLLLPAADFYDRNSNSDFRFMSHACFNFCILVQPFL